MADVWRAEQLGAEGFHRTVAVKRMHGHLASSQQWRALFVREAQVNALLDHPNVVQALDFGYDASGLYLVTEYVEGLTLRDISTLCATFGVRTSPVLVAAIGIEVLRALEAAHSHVERTAEGTRIPRPIIHRDLAPTNVLLSVRGVVKLADFGLARALDDAGLTPAGAVMNKVRYCSPEVARGGAPDATADLYGCAVMLWEAISGRDLWAGYNTTQVVLALANGARPAPLRDVRNDVPMALAAVIDRGLAPRLADRYHAAAAFARDLSDVLRTIPERTDTTRLATEVENALQLRRQLDLTAMHNRMQPPAGYGRQVKTPLPQPSPMRRGLPPATGSRPVTRPPTLAPGGHFPRVGTPIGLPAGQVQPEPRREAQRPMVPVTPGDPGPVRGSTRPFQPAPPRRPDSRSDLEATLDFEDVTRELPERGSRPSMPAVHSTPEEGGAPVSSGRSSAPATPRGTLKPEPPTRARPLPRPSILPGPSRETLKPATVNGLPGGAARVDEPLAPELDAVLAPAPSRPPAAHEALPAREDSPPEVEMSWDEVTRHDWMFEK